MSALLALALFAPALPAASGPPAAERAAPAPALRGAQCLDPGMARGFVTLDDHSLLLDAGRNRYRIQVAASCWNLDFANVIGFRGDPIMNRVCGGNLDAVLVRGNAPCRIERMELLDKAAYRQLLAEHDAARRARAQARKSGSQ
jgi:hypothetical protein